ncbi:MAG TPA: PAS domain S-box protein, partial [Syntrophales bacterium]
QDKGYIRYKDLPLETKEGKPVAVEFVSNVYKANGNKVIQCNIRNITDRKQAEEALRNSEVRLHTLVQTIPDLIWLKDNDGVYLACNTMFERFFGAKERDIIGKTDYDFMDRELADFFHGHDRNAMVAGKPTSNEEWITFADDGHRAFLDTIKTPMYDAQGTLIGVLGIGRDITERKQAEEALRESEKRYRELTDFLPISIFEVDVAGSIISFNRTALEVFRYNQDDYKEGMSTLQFFAPEEWQRVGEDIGRVIQGKSIPGQEYTFFRKDGSTFIGLIYASPNIQENKTVGIRGAVIDITERKRVEEGLVWKTAFFEAQVEATIDGILVVDDKGKKILANTNILDMWKVPPHIRDDTNDKPLLQYVKSLTKHPEQFLEKVAYLNDHPYEISSDELEFKDGMILDRYSPPVIGKDGKYYGRIWTFRDITKHKQAEEELRRYAADISDLYNNAPCGYHSLGPEGTFLRMNDSELRWLGYTRDEIIGKKHFSDILTPKSRQLFQEIYPVFKERGWAGNLEVDVIRKDGTILPVLLNATAIRDTDGNYIMSRSTLFDNTERKRTEAELDRYHEGLEAMVGIRTNELELKNAELEETRVAAVSANQAKSDFLASMSHELRTPLNAIIGFSDVLLNAYFGALNEKQKEYTIDILESGKHLLNLINDVLDISKVEAGKMELELAPAEIGNLLASCVVMIKEKTQKHGIDIKVDIPKELLSFEMFADQRKIKQIMFNLLSNAAKFTPNGGAITLSAVRMLQEGKGFLEVSVTETGMGIPPEYQEKIFESFYQIRGGLTDKTPGTGLGLSVAKQLVELHGGEIRLKSGGREKGSQFCFTLPVRVN